MTERPLNNPVFGLLLAALLGGCVNAITPGVSNVPESEETLFAASPANIASLTEVVQRNPNDPQAYNMRGSVLGLAARYDEAVIDFNKAITLDPQYAQAYANRALAYRQTNKLEQALADYNKAIEIDPNYAGAY